MKWLRLENFMLHEDSQVDFSCPITLITGANGSGKTQILDALLLALGTKSQRIRKQGLSDLIGPASDEARVTLTLNNPLLPITHSTAARPLTTGDRETDRLTDADEVNVVIEMRRSAETLSYRLGPPGAERKVTGAKVERLFSQAGVSARNSLAFTEEGTISNFSSDSPTKQFEAFLETTSLLELRATLQAVLGEVANCQSRLEPLKQQYHIHRTLLDAMRTDLENLERREELEAQNRALETELAWAHARTMADEADVLRRARDAQIDRGRLTHEALKDTVAGRESARRDIENFRTQIDSLEVKTRNRNIRLGELREAQRNATENDGHLTRDIDKRQQKLDASVAEFSPQTADEWATRVDTAKQTVTEKTTALRQLENEIERHRVLSMRGLRDGTGSSALRRHGVMFLTKCLELRRLAETIATHADADAARMVFGPLVTECSVASTIPADRRDIVSAALPALIGDWLTDFIVTDADALTRLIEAIQRDRAFGAVPPPFRLHLLLPDPTAPESAETGGDFSRAPWQPLESLIVAPPAVRQFLRERVPSGFWNDSTTTETPTAAAVQRIATAERRRLFVPTLGLIVGPNGIEFPDRTGLETADRLHAGLDDLRAVAEALEQINELEPRKKTLAVECAEASEQYEMLRGEYGVLDDRLKQQAALRVEIAEIVSKRDAIRQRLTAVTAEIARLEADTADVELRADYQAKLHAAQKRLAELESLESRQQGEIELAEIKAQDLSGKLATKMTEAQTLKVAASALGPAPSATRSAHEIEADANKIRGTLDELRRVTRTREEYDSQKARVDDLQAQVEMAKSHLEALESDLQSRLREWKTELHDRLTGAETVLKHLLRGHFDDVKLGVTDALRRQPIGAKSDGNRALDLRVQRRQGRLLRLHGLCGGEKVLVVEGLIFALHCLTDSPIHALDEFTQKLDVEFKSVAFRMALDAVTYARTHSKSVFAPQFVLLCPDTLGVDIDSPDVAHVVVIRAEAPPGNDSSDNFVGPSRARKTTRSAGTPSTAAIK